TDSNHNHTSNLTSSMGMSNKRLATSPSLVTSILLNPVTASF
ncbi:MAG: hypothetical protein BKPUNTRY_003045, partial [Candidatus Fervidibacter sp.]